MHNKKKARSQHHQPRARTDQPSQEPSKPEFSDGVAAGAISSAQVPARLRDLPHWLVWRYATPDKPDAKPRKVPYYVTGRKRSGKLGSAQDVKQLAPFDAALAAASEGNFDGVGLAVLPEQGLTIIDLDNCIDDDGVFSDFANELIAAGSYVERSPSGRGLRAVFEGEHLVGGSKWNGHIDNGERVEVYEGGAYVTITGRRVSKASAIGRMPDAMADRLRAGMGASSAPDKPADSTDGLLSMNAAPLPNMTPAQALRVLKGLPERWGAPEEGTWYRVAAAVHMQFDGSEEGWQVLDEWSRDRPGYDYENNRARWDAGFSHARGKQAVTSMKNLVFEARDAGVRFKQKTLRAWGLQRKPEAQHQPIGDDAIESTLVTAKDIDVNQHKGEARPLGVACPVGPVALAGSGGTGKSTIAATWAAHVTNGKPCVPWESAKPAKKRKAAGVLWLSTEEGREIIVARHRAIGGDDALLFLPPVKVPAHSRDAEGYATESNVDIERHLRPWLRQKQRAGTPIRLVVCDTLVALVNWGDRDPHRDADVKGLMHYLKEVGEEFGCCILFAHHLNKRGDADDEHRMTGAQAWRESPRLSWMVQMFGGQGFIYVNKANDHAPVGCTFRHVEVAEHETIDAEMDGQEGGLRVMLRRAAFGERLMEKHDLLAERDLAKATATREPPVVERMAATVREVFGVLGEDDLPAALVWEQVRLEHGRKPNSTEKPEVCRLAGVQGARGKPNLKRVGAAV